MKNAIEEYKSKYSDNNAKNYYDACVNLMDDDLREELHSKLAPCTDELFLERYCDEHLKKFGQEFIVN